MKKLKEIFHRVARAIPGASQPETLEDAQDAIIKDSSYVNTLKKWGNNIGVTALTLVGAALFAKTGLVLIPAIVVGAVYGVVQGGIALLKRDIRTNRVAEARFIQDLTHAAEEGPTPQPLPSPDMDLAGAFKAKADNDNARRIKELEQQLAGLEVEAEQRRKAKEIGLTNPAA